MKPPWCLRFSLVACAAILLCLVQTSHQASSPAQKELQDRSGARRFLSAKSERPLFKTRPGRGIMCMHCCVSPADSSRRAATAPQKVPGGQKVTRRISNHYPHDTFLAWPAPEGSELLPGLTHVVWTLEHKNVLFNLAEAANAWRTWLDIGRRVNRVLLGRAPHDNYQWLYSQLRGGPTAPTDLPEVLTSPACFEKVVVGSVTRVWEPWEVPWGLRCRRPDLKALDSTWHMGFASYLQTRLPALPRQGDAGATTPPCRAVVQLRGAAEGPDRENRGRNFLNSQKVVEMLRGLGFLVHALELRGTTMPEAGAIMHASHLMVAPHGAGVANLVFCRPGGHTTVVELHNWGAQKWGYESFAMAFGVKYEPLVCSSTSQCPLNPEAAGPQRIEQESAGIIAREDLCRKGIHNPAFYSANHTFRDINADTPSILSIAQEVLSRLQSDGVCHVSPQAASGPQWKKLR